MKAKITIMSNIITEETIDELNAQSTECKYSVTTGSNLVEHTDKIVIIFELLRSMGYAAAYDLCKAALLLIICKIQEKTNKNKTENTVTVICGEEKYSFIFPFELSESQKEKVVDAAIEKMLKS